MFGNPRRFVVLVIVELPRGERDVARDEENDRVSNARRLLLPAHELGAPESVVPNVLSRLQFGDVWWIPSSITRFDNKPMRPWVIVRGYSSRRAGVVVSPRTTQMNRRHRGLAMPPGVPMGLNKEGLVLLEVRRTINVKDFQDCEYVNRLSNRWIEQIRQFLVALTEGEL